MPLWVQIALVGEKHLKIFKANEALKSPLLSRLEKAVGLLIGAELPNNAVNHIILLSVDAALSMNIFAIWRDNAANVRILIII
jgi:hypothetical protein